MKSGVGSWSYAWSQHLQHLGSERIQPLVSQSNSFAFLLRYKDRDGVAVEVNVFSKRLSFVAILLSLLVTSLDARAIAAEWEDRDFEPSKFQESITAALDWLAEHQMADGGWSFDHTTALTCGGKCKNKGQLSKHRNAATALALSALLDSNQTHLKGRDKAAIARGLRYLMAHAKRTPNGNSHEDENNRMHGHDLAAMVLCRVYSSTQDKHLRKHAQRSLDYTCHILDQNQGGWRYAEQKPDEKSICGWRLLPIREGHMGYLTVPRETLNHSIAFLDKSQVNGGVEYAHIPGKDANETATAVGLLWRAMLGWKRDDARMLAGIKLVSERGPSKNDLSYNCFVHELLPYGDFETRMKWNEELKQRLLDSQVGPGGHDEGSWYFDDVNAKSGGRLYCTALAARILMRPPRWPRTPVTLTPDEDFPE